MEVEEEEGVTLRRVTKRFAGGCEACFKDGSPDSTPRLMLQFPLTFISLCAYHEGELLERLLRNYIRRKNRGSAVGFRGALSKEPTEGDAGELEDPEEEELIQEMNFLDSLEAKFPKE